MIEVEWFYVEQVLVGKHDHLFSRTFTSRREAYEYAASLAGRLWSAGWMTPVRVYANLPRRGPDVLLATFAV